MTRKPATEKLIPPVTLDITFQDIYNALGRNGCPSTVANVKKLCDYLEGIARDAARNALAKQAELLTLDLS